jgi:very-short-patch-repair endonuclease
MEIKELKPRKVLNKAFLKVKPNRTEIEGFKTNLITLLDRTNETESEEFHKNLVSDFLKETYYKQNHFINTKARNDLVIHNGGDANSTVGVILEAKKPTNKAEMITAKKLNSKAFQELVLYYLRERITHKNLEVKHLVATNINEWFIFDATLFDRLFAQNKNLVKQFTDFEEGRLADTKTDFFYKQIAEPFIDSITSEIEFTYFNLQDFQKPLRNTDKSDDNSLIALFKLLSPEHLLKLPFTNDSNSLDKRFYTELLHIIGLTETKEGSKKLIGRNKEGERHTGTILEDAIIQLDSMDKLSRLDRPNQFGNTQQERLFNVALELSITWINRILFLKLLEAQLITYHKGDKTYSFLNIEKIKNYDELNSLFFQVLARKYDERNEDVKKIFEKVPYLNSSLFEPTDIEHLTLFISNLKDDKTIPVISSTVLKDLHGKKRTGNLTTLEYLFEFLNAYDFSSEGSEVIQEDNKTLINASVLGLIFEKINGYKDGSFFTPGFITMYMCRETIRKAVVQKFNEAFYSRMDTNLALSKRRTIIPYNPNLKELARELRNNSTKSEIILWNELKGKFEGKYDFHRQKPLDNFIADFFCHELNLVIEIDGETHNWEETQQKDYKKEFRLNELGINVLRFPDSDIFNHLEATLNTIRQYIIGFEKGDLSELKYEDSPLNPLTGNVAIINTTIKSLSRGNTPLNPLSRDNTPLNPLSRGDFKSLDDVYEQIGEERLFTRQQANQIVNSIKICDPSVGSGHFLVSALNEMIAVKNDLKILQDRDGKRLKEYQVEVVNDELIVTDEEGELFEYTPSTSLNPHSKGDFKVSESQRIQETLFHEKQTIIENCLFGVDINPNSVKICRLRLWIELLKNAYYKNRTELETLPNIDINIKCGNSLVSRFPIDADLKQALKKSKWTIDSYRIAVDTYRNAETKEQKREMERLIAIIKSDFRSDISLNDPKVKKLSKLYSDLLQLTNQGQLFEMSKKEIADWNKKVLQITEETKKLETEIEEIKANKIFENAFEWRFEFPEVLNDDGYFVGFDVVIGNPPYGVSIKDKKEREYLVTNLSKVPDFEIYYLFINKGHHILKQNGVISYIIPNTILFNVFAQSYRLSLFDSWALNEILDCTNFNIFEDATVRNIIFQFTKDDNKKNTLGYKNTSGIEKFEQIVNRKRSVIPKETAESNIQNWGLVFKLDKETLTIVEKIKKTKVALIELFPETSQGLIAYDRYQGQSAEIIKSRAYHHFSNPENKFKRWLYGEDITRYSVKWNGKEYIDYCDRIANPRDPKFFKGKRLLIREITNPRVFAAITNEELYNDPAIIIIKENSDSFPLECLLAIFNSKLATFYHFNSSPKATKGAFPKILVYDVNNYPLPKHIDKKMQEKIETLVGQILTKKSKENSADTTELESQIDQLVYQLYGLTEEEIKIIEKN